MGGGNLDDYKRHWSRCKKWYTPLDYQLFSRYIGDDINIVPECVSHNIIEPVLNPVRYRGFYEDKNMFDKVLPVGFLPQTYIRGIGGLFYTATYEQIEKMTTGKIMDLTEGALRVVVKPSVASSSGRGVELFALKNGMYENLHTEEVLDEAYLNSHYKGNFIIQEALVQSKTLSIYNQSSINTLRLLVYRSVKDNKCRVINACLRVGKKGSHLDNAHAGGLIVGIGDYGRLAQFAVNQYGDVFNAVNDVPLKGAEHFIPEWKIVTEFACAVGDRISHHRLLSLDVALCGSDHDGIIEPKLLEYNLSSLGTWCWQFTNKSVYNDYTDEILDYCLIKKPTKAYLIRN